MLFLAALDMGGLGCERVPELLVGSVTKSIEFWCGLCGFQINYQRPEEGFAYISLGVDSHHA